MEWWRRQGVLQYLYHVHVWVFNKSTVFRFKFRENLLFTSRQNEFGFISIDTTYRGWHWVNQTFFDAKVFTVRIVPSAMLPHVDLKNYTWKCPAAFFTDAYTISTAFLLFFSVQPFSRPMRTFLHFISISRRRMYVFHVFRIYYTYRGCVNCLRLWTSHR